MTDVKQLITGYMDIWTAAETEKKSGRGRASANGSSVYGVKKLRELILELAVRGKLVPQDPNDEPASELLKRIQAEKAKLIAEGKLKKEKPLVPIAEDEKPFALPQGWEWLRLGELFTFEYGDNLPEPKRTNTGEYPVYGSNGIVGTHNECFVNSKCIVIGRKGSAGALNLSLSEGCCVTDVAYYCIPPTELDLIFTFKLFHTLGLDELGKGIKPGLNRNEAYELVIAIPPLAEQHRIVAKVDELMALCDQLEQQHSNAQQAHETLVSQLLATLTHPHPHPQKTTPPFNQRGAGGDSNWQRIQAHFDLLFTTEASIDALKQTLLQLAVMGKLVPQDPFDEPASELLKRIQAEKAKLVAEGKLKKEKPLAPIAEEEKPFELPQGWEWVRFGDALINRDAERIPISSDIRQTRKGDYDYYGASGVIDKIDKYLFDKPLLLIGEDGANLINRSTPIAFIARGKYWVNNHAHVLDGLNEQFLRYIELYINAIDLKSYVTGTAQPKMNQAKMNSILLGLPPESEQHRIATKVDALMTLCDQLKTRLQQAGQQQQAIADALVAQAVQ